MKQIALITIKSVYGKIDPFKRDNSFEVNFINLTFVLNIFFII